jgi:D-glycero-D-manno-heptose 1,7-bisphosphate phosphatase
VPFQFRTAFYMDPVSHPFNGSRLGGDLLWRDIRVERFAHPIPALFLDRDGVIIDEKGYVSRPEDVELLPGAGELIAAAKQLGMAVVEVTNQAGIGRGYYGWPDFVRVEDEVTRLLAREGATIDAVFACPYHPEGQAPYRQPNHSWRKPNAGMFFEAAQLLNLDLGRSVMTGDKDLDQFAGRAAKLKFGMHVLTGYGRQCEGAARAAATENFAVHVAGDAREAATVLEANFSAATADSRNSASLTQAPCKAEERPCAS